MDETGIAGAVDQISQSLGLGDSAEDQNAGGKPSDNAGEAGDQRPAAGVQPAVAAGDTGKASGGTSAPGAPGVPGATPAAADPAAAAPAQAQGVRAPDSWRPQAKEAFAALPPVVQEEVTKREQDLARYAGQVREPVAVAHKLGEVLMPHLAFLEQNGVNTFDHIGGLLQIHQQVVTGTAQQRLEAVAQIVRASGLDPQALMQGIAQLANSPQNDPRVAQIERTAREALEKATSVASAAQQAHQAEVKSKIVAFASDPKNEFFEQVAGEMVQIINAGEKDLAKAYDKAVWLNPVTRAQLTAKEAQALADKQRKEAAEKAKSAEKASRTNVRRTQPANSTRAPVARNGKIDLDATLRDSLADIRSRETS